MLPDVNAALEVIEDELTKFTIPKQPYNLYDPVRYILSNGGKRVRPALALLSCNLFTEDYRKAIYPALGIEFFHNFTLLHDDLMDNSPVRRNKPTVHKKWNANIAILSGDVMSIMASQLISRAEPLSMPVIMAVFNATAIEVCEGQMMDMDFETRNDVSVDEYLKMIGLKTSVLLAASLKIGAIAGGANEKAANDIYTFGYNLGVGFQLQDDLLDTFGDTERFGKKIGNDILTNKKTYLYLKALELSDDRQRKDLTELYSISLPNSDDKIRQVKKIFKELKIQELTKELIQSFFMKANQVLEEIPVEETRKLALKNFAAGLRERDK